MSFYVLVGVVGVLAPSGTPISFLLLVSCMEEILQDPWQLNHFNVKTLIPATAFAAIFTTISNYANWPFFLHNMMVNTLYITIIAFSANFIALKPP